ncbi:MULTISPECIES: DUF748 domain-containing protein [unclassified Vibrio]|uniref:DUF748 domain-containing protein n=1 Tax=Vibrio sp. HB236076 TaxID=3232307 RepID=A0AB39HJX6_9VIBR|nr:DUF748 domain-containing protein [Vibrio sp. HB161653]MDP5253154.1 DUF748 domain-containing protein [Vibrio sp. HB161653]
MEENTVEQTQKNSGWQRFKSQPWWIKLTAYLVLLYAVFLLLAGVVLPAAAKHYAPPWLSDTLGRPVAISDVKFNPFLWRARIDGFVIGEAQEKTPGDATETGVSAEQALFSFSRLEVELQVWRSLLDLTPTVDHIFLQQPQTTIARVSNERFSFSDILDHLAKRAAQKEPEPEQEPQEESGIPALLLNQLVISDGAIYYDDQPTGSALSYDDLNFAIKDFNTHYLITESTPSADSLGNDYQVNFVTNKTGQVSLKGQVQLQPLKLNGQVALNKIALTPLWSFVKAQIPATLSSGQLNFTSRYQVSQKQDQLVWQIDKTRLSLLDLAFLQGDEQKISLGSLKLGDIKADSQSQKVTIDGLMLDKLDVNGAFKQGELDLVSLFMPKTDQASPATSSANSQVEKSDDAKAQESKAQVANSDSNTTAEPAWLVELKQFKLTQSNILLHEQTIAKDMVWQVSPQVTLTGIRSDLSSPIDYQVSLAMAGQNQQAPQTLSSQLEAKGQVAPQLAGVKGDITLSEWALPWLQTYLEPYAHIAVKEGRLNAKLALDWQQDSGATIKGETNIDGLNVVDTLMNKPLLKWQDLALIGLDFDQQKNHLAVDTVAIDQPYFTLQIDQQKKTNVSQLAKTTSATQAASQDESHSDAPSPVANDPSSSTAQASSAPAFSFDINNIKIIDGATDFADLSLTPSFAASIELLNGVISPVSSEPSKTTKIDLSGKIDRYAPVSVTGTVKPFSPTPELDIGFSVEGAELTSVSPYSGTYMGRYIDKGLLSLDVQYSLQDNQLRGENRVVIDQLKLGKASNSKQALNLPLGLAIALLQDRNGVIDLGLPVSGDLDSPSFSVGGIILKALGNVITKAVTAPFSFLANLVGSDEPLDKVAYLAGSSELTPDAVKKLDTLAEALTKRPNLNVDVQGQLNEKEDARSLAEQKAQALLLAQPLVVIWPEDFSPSEIAQHANIAEALQTVYQQQVADDIDQQRQGIIDQATQQGQTLTEEQVNTSLDILLYQKLVSAQSVSQQEMVALATARSQAVKRYLVNENNIKSSRVFIVTGRGKKNNSAEASLSVKAP